MKTILLLGVGRSTHTLIKYLVNYAKTESIKIIFSDQSLSESDPFLQARRSVV